MLRSEAEMMRRLSPEARLSMARERHFRTCISIAFHDERRDDIVTLLNVRYPTADALRADYEALRAEFDEDDADLMVDLYVEFDLLDTFLIRRQSLQRFRASVNQAASVAEHADPLTVEASHDPA